MEIKILGSGCAKCSKLEAVTREAVARLGLDVPVEHVTDFAEIASYGVMSTPVLVVDGQVRLAGRVPTIEDVVAILDRA